MQILITGADHSVGLHLAQALRHDHSLRLTGIAETPPSGLEGLPYAAADLRNEARVAEVVRGVSAILHVEPYALSEYSTEATASQDAEILERAARGTFMLLRQALQSGVDQVVLLSRLDLLATHPPDAVIDETWKPLPDPTAPAFAAFTAELTVREFVRAEALRACCFRIGALNQTPNGTSTELVIHAVRATLTADWSRHPYRWNLYHLGGGERFPNHAVEQPPLCLSVR